MIVLWVALTMIIRHTEATGISLAMLRLRKMILQMLGMVWLVLLMMGHGDKQWSCGMVVNCVSYQDASVEDVVAVVLIVSLLAQHRQLDGTEKRPMDSSVDQGAAYCYACKRN